MQCGPFKTMTKQKTLSYISLNMKYKWVSTKHDGRALHCSEYAHQSSWLCSEKWVTFCCDTINVILNIHFKLLCFLDYFLTHVLCHKRHWGNVWYRILGSYNPFKMILSLKNSSSISTVFCFMTCKHHPAELESLFCEVPAKSRTALIIDWEALALNIS